MVGRKGNKKRERESQEEGPAQAEAGGMGKRHRMGSTWKVLTGWSLEWPWA